MNHTTGAMTEVTVDSTLTRSASTEFDDWAADPEQLAGHLTAIVERLGDSGDASARRRWPYLVNPAIGHLNGRELCWICTTGLAHSGTFLPRFRACRWCLGEDQRQAKRLGLLHLLPVFNYAFPPVRSARRAARLTPEERQTIAQVWSQVSVLAKWRRDSVQVAHGWLGLAPGEEVDLFDWQRRLSVGESRSRACWQAYVEGYQPDLASVLSGQAAMEVRA